MQLRRPDRLAPSESEGSESGASVLTEASVSALAESRSAETRVALVSSVRVHESGHAGLRAMLAAIREARRSIHLETYLLRDDRVGRDFAAALSAAVSRGVEVRVLYDGLSAVLRGGAVRRAMRQAGVELAAFNPLREVLRGRSPRVRDHRKLLIVDAEIGFVGGLNIGEEYDGAAAVECPEEETGWRDTELALRGPVVTTLTRLFARAWNRTRVGRRSPLALREEVPARGLTVIADGERLRERHTRNALVALLDASRESALLTTPYFLPDRRLRRALARAALRGVRVELLTAGRSDHPWILRAARAELPSLLRRGVRVWLYDAAMLHAKVALFDARIALVGTSNLDRQSLHRNLEVNLRIEGDPAVLALLRGFERDRTRSLELSLQDAARRRVWDRILDELCRLASRLV